MADARDFKSGHSVPATLSATASAASESTILQQQNKIAKLWVDLHDTITKYSQAENTNKVPVKRMAAEELVKAADDKQLSDADKIAAFYKKLHSKDDKTKKSYKDIILEGRHISNSKSGAALLSSMPKILDQICLEITELQALIVYEQNELLKTLNTEIKQLDTQIQSISKKIENEYKVQQASHMSEIKKYLDVDCYIPYYSIESSKEIQGNAELEQLCRDTKVEGGAYGYPYSFSSTVIWQVMSEEKIRNMAASVYESIQTKSDAGIYKMLTATARIRKDGVSKITGQHSELAKHAGLAEYFRAENRLQKSEERTSAHKKQLEDLKNQQNPLEKAKEEKIPNAKKAESTLTNAKDMMLKVSRLESKEIEIDRVINDIQKACLLATASLCKSFTTELTNREAKVSTEVKTEQNYRSRSYEIKFNNENNSPDPEKIELLLKEEKTYHAENNQTSWKLGAFLDLPLAENLIVGSSLDNIKKQLDGLSSICGWAKTPESTNIKKLQMIQEILDDLPKSKYGMFGDTATAWQKDVIKLMENETVQAALKSKVEVPLKLKH